MCDTTICKLEPHIVYNTKATRKKAVEKNTNNRLMEIEMKLDIPSNSMIIEPHIREAILDYYKRCGISFDFRAPYDTSCALKGYLMSLRKTIIPRKRKVYISRELLQKSSSADYVVWKQRFDEMRKWFENGDDIRLYLSVHYKESTFQDRLLNCWKMHHIHFDPSKKFDDMLLFAMVYDDAAYFIDVLPHRKKAVFSTYNLLNIVYDNWKKLLAPFEVKGATTVIAPILTDEDIEEARKAGLTTFIKVRDKVYLLDSQAANCDSATDGMTTNRILNTIRKNQVEGRLNDCRFVKLHLTEKVHPCMIIEYLDQDNLLRQMIL